MRPGPRPDLGAASYEADAHVDCTTGPGGRSGGVHAIRAQFNHDEYGYLKLRGLSCRAACR